MNGNKALLDSNVIILASKQEIDIEKLLPLAKGIQKNALARKRPRWQEVYKKYPRS